MDSDGGNSRLANIVAEASEHREVRRALGKALRVPIVGVSTVSSF